MNDWNAGVDPRLEPQDDERQILIDKVEDLQAEVDQLRRYCKEWVCEACETCFPDPPHPGVLCVVCPKCRGLAMPYPLWEVRKMMGQRDALLDALRLVVFSADCGDPEEIHDHTTIMTVSRKKIESARALIGQVQP